MMLHTSRKQPALVTFFILAIFLTSCSTKREGKPRVLVFSKTSGYHHESIPNGLAAIVELGKSNEFDVDTTTNAGYFNEDSLKKYSAVIFLSTTGDLLNHYQEADFERYIQAGGGYVGVHAAADGEYDWGWYGRLAGGYFLDHPGINDTFPNVQPGQIKVVKKDHPATEALSEDWTRTDEWYSFKKSNPDVTHLLKLDEASYNGGKKNGDHPISWYHEYDGGRAFYTALGHTKESYNEPLFLKHLAGGIQYAIGKNLELDYDKAKSLRTPEESRFKKTALASGDFYEPTEMTILPNLDILIAQRRGEILLWKKRDSTVTQVGFLNAYFKTKVATTVNAEEGVLGIQADPDFSKNHFVFIFYSPADTSVNRLSRFKFENDKLDPESEQVILQFYSQREICCHTGGSIAFDKDGLLFVSTGDNSTPFNEPNQRYVNQGYAPLDDRPGHEQYDARRTSGNANDLRGKILRIRVNEDGTYDIPKGNLYENQKGTRPEIYVQGNRNPYRISVDKKNGFLYWGEVGPDANIDSLETRGPRGYDELNQARNAGFFGWPLFVGNNYPYHEFDYATGKSGENFDPAKPVNNSKNNTGIQTLPPVQPAFIWYPYDASPDFPQVKTGGRNAMAGPVYYTDMFPSSTRLPEYYHKKLFIYDWIRGWIKAVTLLPNGDFDKMEPFMENTKLNALIDLEVGPDGKLYLLEYGNGWFTKNKDSGLSVIDFNGGNQLPTISSLEADKISGTLPHTVTVTAKALDPENGKLRYRWNLEPGIQKETILPTIDHTFTKSGQYNVTVEAIDEANGTTRSSPLIIYAGNKIPEVQIQLSGNKSFYFPGRPVHYSVLVKDDDATDPSGLFISSDYIEGSDKAESTQGHQQMTEVMTGLNLTQSLDCKTCHKQEESSIGPAYRQVAKHYEKSADAYPKLVSKIIKGGSGVWGETNMPAHPDLKESEATQIVSWIMSLNQKQLTKSLPASGSVDPTQKKRAVDNGVFSLSASYTDKGASGIKPLTGTTELSLRSAKITMDKSVQLNNFKREGEGKSQALVLTQSTGSFSIEGIDLTEISAIQFNLVVSGVLKNPFVIKAHLNSPDGTLIGQEQTSSSGNITMKIKPVIDKEFHKIIFSCEYLEEKTGTMKVQSIEFK